MVAVNIGEHSFKTQAQALQYVRNILKEVGITNSVLSSDEHAFNFLFKLCERHPHKDEKLKNIKDLVIKSNPINKKHLALYILNHDGFYQDISFHVCVKGKPNSHKSELRRALRYSVEYQIQEYRNNVKNKCICQNCNSLIIGEYHIHHKSIEFEDLVQQFLQTQSEIPDEFDEDMQTSQRIFLKQHKVFEDNWKLHHKENAILQLVCRTCNLSTLKKQKCKI